MSSDNFYLVRRCGSRFAVSMEFASDGDNDTILGQLDHPTPIDDKRITFFDDLDGAVSWANGQYSEYGVTLSLDEDAAGDTRIERLRRAAALLGHRYDVTLWSNLPSGGVEITTDAGVTVTLAGESGAVEELANWITALMPDALADRLAVTEPATAI